MQPILRTKFIGGKPVVVEQVAAREMATPRSIDDMLVTVEDLLRQENPKEARKIIRDFLGWTIS